MIQQTSLMAYRDIQKDIESLNSHYQEIIEALQYLGDATDREIARYLEYSDPNIVRPRRNELADPSRFNPTLVTSCGRRKCRVSNRTCISWRLNDGVQ